MSSPIKFFLIDDDEDDQEIFRMALKDINPNIEVEGDINSQKAIIKLKSEKDYTPSFIFIDINMPLLDGRECLEEIKKIERLRKVPVFMYSTSADPKMLSTTKALGALDFIIKPVNIAELTNTLRKILSLHK